MNEHKEKIVNGEKAASILERMAVAPPHNPTPTPIGMRKEALEQISLGSDALTLCNESRRMLEEARAARMAMEYAAAKSRETASLARVAVTKAFGGTTMAIALLGELTVTEHHLEQIPMPKPDVPRPT